MRWPLVSADRYDNVVGENHELQLQLQDARARLAEAMRLAAAAMAEVSKIADTMLANYHALRVGGANVPVTLVPLPKAERDEVADAIELSAGPDLALARHLARWAKQQKLDGAREHDIIQSILHWHQATEDEPNLA